MICGTRRKLRSGLSRRVGEAEIKSDHVQKSVENVEDKVENESSFPIHHDLLEVEGADVFIEATPDPVFMGRNNLCTTSRGEESTRREWGAWKKSS